MENCLYEVDQNGHPPIDSIALANNLEKMIYNQPRALVELRKKLRASGYEQQAREITYALRHGTLWKSNKLSGLFGDIVQYILFEFTSAWGLHPQRALILLVSGIPLFSIIYFLAMCNRSKDGIWILWSDNRIRKDVGRNEPQLIFAWDVLQAYQLSIYFSVLSAFHIGWRDFNVGSWITRLQANEFVLKPTGWVRTVAGIQSLVSVYLLAIFVLTYFGKPFE